MEETNSEWVRFEDYARLKAEVEAVTQEYRDATNHYNKLHNDLQAKVERLCKAGDAMCKFFDDHGFYGFGFQEAWNAAKEGKQP